MSGEIGNTEAFEEPEFIYPYPRAWEAEFKEAGLLEQLPVMRKLKSSEDDCARERVLDAEEYQALLAASPRWLQRVLIAAHEARLSRWTCSYRFGMSFTASGPRRP